MKRAAVALAALLAGCTGEVTDLGAAAAGPDDDIPIQPPAADAQVAQPGDPDAGPEPDPGPMPTAETGGYIALPRCGYNVFTRKNATAPWPAPPGEIGPDPMPRQVHLGLAGDAARSIAVVWRTRDESTLATSVRYGVERVDEQRLEGFTFRYRSGSASDSPRVRIHEAHLCGLRPDTIYRYQVGSDGAWSPEYTFRTAPDPALDPSAQVTVAVLGDSRGAPGTFGSILGAVEAAADPDLLLFTGDAVTSGVNQAQWDAFFEAGASLLPYIPAVFTNGNHEYNAINFYAQVALPGNEETFGLDYGPLHLTVLNDSPNNSATITGSQKDFLARDLAAHAATPWRLLMHHRTMWSASSGHGSSTSLQDAWGPTVDGGRVALVLAGHDHNYERTKPLRAKAAAADGTTYLVAGGAGAELYTNGHAWFTAFSEKRRHFVILDVRPGALDGRAHREDGSLMDRFSMAPR